MTQVERDRLIVLKKARKGVITQKEAALELEVGERQVRLMLLSSMTALYWGWANWTGRLPEPSREGVDVDDIEIHRNPVS